MLKSFIVNVNDLTKPTTEEGLGRIFIIDSDNDIPYGAVEELEDLPVEVTPETKLYKLVKKMFLCSDKLEEIVVYGDTTIEDEESLETTLNKLLDEQKSDWFFLASTINDGPSVKKLAQFAENNDKVYFATIQDLSIVENLKETKNTAIGYHENETDFLAEGLMVNMAMSLAGSRTAKFEQVPGSVPSDISLKEIKKLHKDNGFTYIRSKGVNYVSEGKMTDGSYIDITLGAYFIKFRLEDALFMLAINNPKVGYNDIGIGMMVAEAETVLKRATAQGIILSEGGKGAYEVTALTRKEMPRSEVANRRYNGIFAKAIVDGAIHDGEVTINLVLGEEE